MIGAAGRVENLVGAGGVAVADAGQAAVLHHDRAVLDDAIILHRDDARAGEGDGAGRDVAGQLQPDGDLVGVAGRRVVRVEAGAAHEFQRVRVAPARMDAGLRGSPG